jgi:hypothetical protein
MPDTDGITEDKVKVIVNEILNSRAVYRDYCIERHKDVEDLKEIIDKLESRFTKLYTILIMTLASVITNLIIILLKK